MKKFRKTGPMTLRRVIGSLHSQRRILPVLAVAAGLLAVSNASAGEINLVTGTSGFATGGSASFPSGATPSSGIYELIDTIPAGTGVFQPFLSYQHKTSEDGVNSTLGGNGQGFLNDKRVPQWTHDVTLGDLGKLTRNGVTYFVFELDANETGSGNPNRLISIDDIRIYTKSANSDPFANISNDNQLHTAIAGDTLGTLRYAQNANHATSGNNNWVLLDASRRTEGSTSGSGSSDMLVLVPTSAFAGAAKTDYLTFYTINGVHDTAGDDGTDAGFEEWRYLSGVPDGGSTLLLLGSALIPLGLLRARREMSSKA